jgi:exonuclease III
LPGPKRNVPSHYWHSWTRNLKLGEAKHPGPSTKFKLLSGNVTSLQVHIKGRQSSLARWIKELGPSALALQEVRLSAEAQQFCATRLPFLGLNPIFGAPLPYQSWLGRSNQTIWNAIAGGTLVGAVAPTPIRELPKDQEQNELHEFGRWTRAAIPIGAGHRSFQVTSFYGPPQR